MPIGKSMHATVEKYPSLIATNGSLYLASASLAAARSADAGVGEAAWAFAPHGAMTRETASVSGTTETSHICMVLTRILSPGGCSVHTTVLSPAVRVNERLAVLSPRGPSTKFCERTDTIRTRGDWTLSSSRRGESAEYRAKTENGPPLSGGPFGLHR